MTASARVYRGYILVLCTSHEISWVIYVSQDIFNEHYWLCILYLVTYKVDIIIMYSVVVYRVARLTHKQHQFSPLQHYHITSIVVEPQGDGGKALSRMDCNCLSV